MESLLAHAGPTTSLRASENPPEPEVTPVAGNGCTAKHASLEVQSCALRAPMSTHHLCCHCAAAWPFPPATLCCSHWSGSSQA